MNIFPEFMEKMSKMESDQFKYRDANVPTVQSTPSLIDDAMVNCILCGHAMPLSQLVDHQSQCPLRPKRKAALNIHRHHVRCIFCNGHPWIHKASMGRHMKRKHPKESAIEQKAAKVLRETEACEALKVDEMTTSQTVPSAPSDPQPFKASKSIATLTTTAFEAVNQQLESRAVSRFKSIVGYPILSVHQDVDGYAELVLTMK